MGSLDSIHEERCPFDPAINILNRDMEMVEQLNEPLHPYLLESLATDELNGAYDQSTQPRGEWNQAVKTNEMPCAEAE